MGYFITKVEIDGEQYSLNVVILPDNAINCDVIIGMDITKQSIMTIKQCDALVVKINYPEKEINYNDFVKFKHN